MRAKIAVWGTAARSAGGGLDPVVLALADRFTAAAVDSTQWLPALQALADATRSQHGQLIGIGSASTEADVALRLAGGESRESIAASRSARLSTVRAQLKSAFAKLGVGREVELAAMLGGLLRR